MLLDKYSSQWTREELSATETDKQEYIASDDFDAVMQSLSSQDALVYDVEVSKSFTLYSETSLNIQDRISDGTNTYIVRGKQAFLTATRITHYKYIIILV